MLGNVPAERLRIIEGIAARAARLAKRKLPVSPADLVRAYYHGVAEEDLASGREPTILWVILPISRAMQRRVFMRAPTWSAGWTTGICRISGRNWIWRAAS